MRSILKGLTLAILMAGFGLVMVPKASAYGYFGTGMIDNGYLGGGCNSCGTTLVQPAVIDNGCNSCGGFYGSGYNVLTQPSIYGGYGGYGSYGYGYGMRRGLFGGGGLFGRRWW